MILIFPGLDMFRVFLQEFSIKNIRFMQIKSYTSFITKIFESVFYCNINIFKLFDTNFNLSIYRNFIISFALLILTYLFIYIYFGYLKKLTSFLNKINFKILISVFKFNLFSHKFFH